MTSTIKETEESSTRQVSHIKVPRPERPSAEMEQEILIGVSEILIQKKHLIKVSGKKSINLSNYGPASTLI